MTQTQMTPNININQNVSPAVKPESAASTQIDVLGYCLRDLSTSGGDTLAKFERLCAAPAVSQTLKAQIGQIMNIDIKNIQNSLHGININTLA